MRFEDNRFYRVKDIAQTCGVSPATIYRAVESGQLIAVRFGAGKGHLRFSGEAANAYLSACTVAAGPADQPPATTLVFVGLSDAQADGRACVTCGITFATTTESHVPVGVAGNGGGQVFACVRHENRSAEADRRLLALVTGREV